MCLLASNAPNGKMDSMNMAPFWQHKKQLFSLPWFNNWKKWSWFIFPYGWKSHFYSTKYYVQTNSKSTSPVYFSIITIKSRLIFMTVGCWNTLKMGLRIDLPSWQLSFELNVNTGVKQNVTSYSAEYKCAIYWYRWIWEEKEANFFARKLTWACLWLSDISLICCKQLISVQIQQAVISHSTFLPQTVLLRKKKETHHYQINEISCDL